MNGYWMLWLLSGSIDSWTSKVTIKLYPYKMVYTIRYNKYFGCLKNLVQGKLSDFHLAAIIGFSRPLTISESTILNAMSLVHWDVSGESTSSSLSLISAILITTLRNSCTWPKA